MGLVNPTGGGGVDLVSARIMQPDGQFCPNDTNTYLTHSVAAFAAPRIFDEENDRLKVPSGFNRALVEFTNYGISDDLGVFLVYVYHYDGLGNVKNTSMASTENGFYSGLNCSLGIIEVEEDDYFRAMVKIQPGRQLYSEMSIILWTE